METINTIRNSHGERLDITLHPGNRDGVLVILGHGLTGNKDRPLLCSLARALADHGYPAMRLSWSGNGGSGGKFSESNITKEIGDLTAVIDQCGTGKKIIYIGHSMGAAVGALTAARDDRIRMLVSLAGMVHTKAFCEREFHGVTPDDGAMWEDNDFPLASAFVRDMHNIGSILDAAREVKVPWLLQHGLGDDIILPEDSRDLHSVIRGKKKLIEIPGANHSFEHHHQQVCQETITWLDQYA